MFSIKDLDVVMADIKNTNVTYMAVKDLLFRPTGGGGSTPRLPVEYQEVEYIASSGTQYIDTNVQINQNYTTEIKCKVDSYVEWNVVFGTRSKSGYSSNSYNRYCIRWNGGSNNKLQVCRSYNSSVNSYETFESAARYDQNIHTFRLNRYLYVDGELVNTFTNDTSTGLFSYAPTLFAQRDPNNPSSNPCDFFHGRVYYCKIWDNNDNLVRDFVPCYRRQDGEPGMYDLVNNEFYNNKGSGTFTMGGDTRKSVLPRGYSEIQYIQSTATNPGTVTSSGQYIDTLYTPNQYTKIAIDMQFQNLTRQSRLFAINETNSSYMTMAAYINGSDKWARAMKNGEGDWISTEVAVDTGRHTFTLKNGNYKINTGNTVNYNASNGSTSSTSARHTLPLLAAWDFAENKIVNHSSAKIFGCTIFEREIMVRNFVPCVSHRTGEVGLYDFVEGKFYPNAGTGEFVPGPRVYYEDFVNIPKDGLLGYWPLSSDLKDYSGNKNDGRWYSGTGAFSKAASKDGARVTTNNPLSTQHIITALNYCQAPITVGGWVCYNAMNSNAWHGMISNSSASGNGCTIGTRPSDNNYPSAVIASGTVVRIDSVVPSTNKRYFWMATNDGTTLKTYQNGVLTNSGPVSSFTNGGVWKLGCAMVDGGQTVNSGTDGWIRHCFVYNRVLDGDEAMEVYKKTSCSERGKSDLTFCDYIESTGTQWIDTGLTGAQADDVEMEFSFPSQPSAVAVPMGVRGENSVADSVIRINESNMIEPRFGSGINTGVEMLAKTKYKVRTEFKSGAQKVYVNDVQKATGTLTYTYNASRTYYLFAFHDTSEVNCKCSCRMYNCKVKLGGTLVRDFVPCFVKYTGEAGMWDTVNEKFYPNIGTGSFGKGYNGFDSSVYQKVEYVGRAGSTQAYFDTLWKPKRGLGFEVKAGARIDNGGYRYCFGTNRTSNTNSYPFSFEINSGSVTNNKARAYSENGSGTGVDFYSSNSLTVGEFNDVSIKSIGKIDLNGTITNGTLYSGNGYYNATWLLFIDRQLRRTDFNHGLAISYMKIYEAGALIRDFVPVYRRSDNVIGLYDVVNDYFYTNAGSGSFTKGADV